MQKDQTPTLVIFHPQGLVVRGNHSNSTPPLPPGVTEMFQGLHESWSDFVRTGAGTFDGPRAVLVDYSCIERVLTLQTAYRTYTEGLALRDTIRNHVLTQGVNNARPRAELSWGLSLSTFILLPADTVLCAQRAQSLAVLPGRWTARHSEVVEPQDIQPDSMDGLLQRLIDEEASALTGLGVPKFVGLAVRQQLHEWQLIGVLDLRHVELSRLNSAFANLVPDAETAAWGVCSIARFGETHSDEFLKSLPKNMRYTAATEPHDISFARELYEKIS